MNDEYGVRSSVGAEDLEEQERHGNDGLHRAQPTPPKSRFEWFWVSIRFCNTFAVTILSVCVVWIFLQLQYITFSLKEESDRIDKLLKEIQESQTQQIEKLDEKVENNHSLTLYQMAGTFTLITCLLTTYHMMSHLKKYNEPIVQRRIMTILWMSPIYSVTAFLALLLPSADGYLAVVRDFYEAYTVYTFLALLIAILGRGDRDAVVNVLAQHADHLKKPTACLRSCYHPAPESSDEAKANAVLYECQVLAMQFVFCRPLTSIASFVTNTIMEDHHDDVEWYLNPTFFIAMVTNVSVFLAFTGLLKFYHAVREDLAWCQPFAKFMAIKGIVFLTFWQGLLIAIVVAIHESRQGSDDDSTEDSSSSNSKTAREQALEIQHILICLEMVFFSIAHLCVFPAEEWQPDYRPKEFQAPTMGIRDFAKDVSFVLSSGQRRKAAQRLEQESTDSATTDAETIERLSPQHQDDDDDEVDPETERHHRGDPLSGGSPSYQQIPLSYV